MLELTTTITPALISANIDELKAYLEVEVSKYDIDVTEDKVKDAKKLATELNSVTKAINAVKKEKLLELEAPIKQFKSDIAELNDIVQSGRSKILSQVKIFEDEVLQEIKKLSDNKLHEEYSIQDVGEKYETATISDLVLLGSITKGGTLTKKVNDEIVARVASAKQKQKQDEAEAEVERLRLEAEVNKRVAEQRERDIRAKEEQKRLSDNQITYERDIVQQEAPIRVVETPLKEEVALPPKEVVEEGKKLLRIAINFDIKVREGAPEDKVLLKMRQLLESAGIPDLVSIGVK